MPVRNIQDKKLRMRLAGVDQEDVDILLKVATEAREGDLPGDAVRILREVLILVPGHAAAQTMLRELESVTH